MPSAGKNSATDFPLYRILNAKIRSDYCLTCDQKVTYNPCMDDEHVFKAMADSSRRNLLDLLFARDGRTLSDLTENLPHEPDTTKMSRFGVSKHLGILEDAGLITTRKVGREKHHFINPVPIQQVYERWVDKAARPWARKLTDLKITLEETPMTELPSHVLQIFIKTTPEKLWQALTDGEISRQYYFGTVVKSGWNVGDTYGYYYPDRPDVMVTGTILECDPPNRLVQTFIPAWNENADHDKPSKVTWEIVQMGDACKLTLTHDDLDPANAPVEGIKEGWSQIISGMKTLLETGNVLVVAAPQAEEA